MNELINNSHIWLCFLIVYDISTMMKILLFLENNFDGINHPGINEGTYNLNNYCVHAYLENGTNYIDVYKKFERVPVERIIIETMKTSKSNDVIKMLREYNCK